MDFALSRHEDSVHRSGRSPDSRVRRLHHSSIPEAFSWDRTNVEEFWNDATSDVKTDYFIGAIVTYNFSSSSYGIVDGQQRPTTITIALCAIRDQYQALGFEAAAKGVHRLIETRDLDNEPIYVLGTETSYPYLQAKIQAFSKEEEDVEVGEEEDALSLCRSSSNSPTQTRASVKYFDTRFGELQDP